MPSPQPAAIPIRFANRLRSTSPPCPTRKDLSLARILLVCWKRSPKRPATDASGSISARAVTRKTSVRSSMRFSTRRRLRPLAKPRRVISMCTIKLLKVSLNIDDNLAHFTYSYSNIGLEQPRQFSEFTMAGTLNIFRMMAGSQWAPREIQFAHDPPESNTEHLRVFGAPVIFRCASNALVMEREFLDQTVPVCGSSLIRNIAPLSRRGA